MKINVGHIAKLANIPLDIEEKKKFEMQLVSVLENFEKLSKLSTDKVEETSQVTGITNILRPDEVGKALSQDEALANAKNVHDGMFVVPVILEEASGT